MNRWQFRTKSVRTVLALTCVTFVAGAKTSAGQDDPATTRHAGTESKGERDKDAVVPASSLKNASLWHDPGKIGSLDLYNGQGGTEGRPVPPFAFVAEDMNGTNPKFDVTDAKTKKWRVKLGSEARPEVTASRFLWAMGFYTNIDYVLPSATFPGISLKRGKQFVKNDSVTDARFARKPKGEKKIGIWRWKNNPFTGTREFNGLRVMMAVLNNWDLKDENNAVFSDKESGKVLLLVSDVGATFGGNNIGISLQRSKGNSKTFENSKFITEKTAKDVSFGTPRAPLGLLLGSGGTTSAQFVKRSRLNWIGEHIPLEDARWMGEMLGQLSYQQITDAFRAGQFTPDETSDFVKTVESRIAELNQLSTGANETPR